MTDKLIEEEKSTPSTSTRVPDLQRTSKQSSPPPSSTLEYVTKRSARPTPRTVSYTSQSEINVYTKDDRAKNSDMMLPPATTTTTALAVKKPVK